MLTDSGEVDERTSAIGGAQASLDGFVQPVAKWSKEGLLEHIVEFVVQEDQVRFFLLWKAFSVVDKTTFRALLKYQCPKMKDSDIPHRTKLRKEILVKAGNVENRLKEHLKVSLSLLLELC